MSTHSHPTSFKPSTPAPHSTGTAQTRADASVDGAAHSGETCRAFPFQSSASGGAAAGTIVLKFGQSVFTHEREALAVLSEIVRHVRRGKRVVAVVSGLWGATERLLSQARKVNPAPTGPSLARLLATAEQASAALLSLALANAGIEHTVLDARDVHLVAVGPSDDADPIALDADVIRIALDHAPVVVVPGFEAIDQRGEPTLLGRGGADLTAVYLAHALGAEARIVRDIDGIYRSDPSRASSTGGAERFRTLAWSDAGSVDDRPVQPKALRFAEAHRVPIRIAAPGSDTGTVIGEHTHVEVPTAQPTPHVHRIPREVATALSA